MISSFTIGFIAFMCMILLLLGFLYEAHGVSSEDIITFPDDTKVWKMCALTDEDPFYNCDEIWAIFFLPTTKDVTIYCYPEKQKSMYFVVAGCATFNDYRGHSVIVGSLWNSTSHTGQLVLDHELLHLKCRCNFHG